MDIQRLESGERIVLESNWQSLKSHDVGFSVLSFFLQIQVDTHAFFLFRVVGSSCAGLKDRTLIK